MPYNDWRNRHSDLSDNIYHRWPDLTDTNTNTYSVPATDYLGAWANDTPGMSSVIPNSIGGAGIVGTERPDEPKIPWDNNPEVAAKPGLDPKTAAGIQAGITILNEVTKAIAAQKAQPTTSQMSNKTRAKIGKKVKKKYFA